MRILLGEYEKAFQTLTSTIDTKERPYVCHCGRTFPRQDLLKRHERRAHREHLQRPGTPSQDVIETSHDVAMGSGNVAMLHARANGISKTSFPGQPDEGEQRGHDSVELISTDTIDHLGGWLQTDSPNIATAVESFVPDFGLLGRDDLELDWSGIDMGMTESQDLLDDHTSPDAHRSRPHQQLNNEVFSNEGCTTAGNLDSLDCTVECPLTQDRGYHNLQTAVRRALPALESPSYLTWLRYVSGYLEGFARDFPFIHIPTMRSESCTPELLLAMAAIGACERFEHHNSLQLFLTSKTILLDRLREWRESRTEGIISVATPPVPPASSCEDHLHDAASKSPYRVAMEALRTLLLLSYLGLYADDISLVRGALDLHDVMIEVARYCGFDEARDRASSTSSWDLWIHEERDRRTKFALFCFLNLQTVVHNVPSPVLCSEWQLRMPCSAEIWEAQDEQEWRAALTRSQSNLFQDDFRALISTGDGPDTWPVKSPGGFNHTIMILALLQRIYYVRQLAAATSDDPRKEEIDRVEYATNAPKTFTICF